MSAKLLETRIIIQQQTLDGGWYEPVVSEVLHAPDGTAAAIYEAAKAELHRQVQRHLATQRGMLSPPEEGGRRAV